VNRNTTNKMVAFSFTPRAKEKKNQNNVTDFTKEEKIIEWLCLSEE